MNHIEAAFAWSLLGEYLWKEDRLRGVLCWVLCATHIVAWLAS